MKLKAVHSFVLTSVALAVTAIAIPHGLNAGIIQDGSQKYEPKADVPPPMSTEKGSDYMQSAPDAKQVRFNKEPHFYEQPSWHFNIWHKPEETGWTARERCRPRPFCPRGYGDLSNKPRTGYRMDYHRYVVEDLKTTHGPSFYRWSAEPQKCCELEKNGCKCNHCRSKKRFRLFRRD